MDQDKPQRRSDGAFMPTYLSGQGFYPVCLVHVSLCPPAGFELLYQPEVVRLYLSLLTESQNYNTLEAAAGALQNLSAGQWTVSRGLGLN